MTSKIIPDPSCVLECKLYDALPMHRTAMSWTPLWDKFGQMINSDPNITSGRIGCMTCERQWDYREYPKRREVEAIN